MPFDYFEYLATSRDELVQGINIGSKKIDQYRRALDAMNDPSYRVALIFLQGPSLIFSVPFASGDAVAYNLVREALESGLFFLEATVADLKAKLDWFDSFKK